MIKYIKGKKKNMIIKNANLCDFFGGAVPYEIFGKYFFLKSIFNLMNNLRIFLLHTILTLVCEIESSCQ